MSQLVRSHSLTWLLALTFVHFFEVTTPAAGPAISFNELVQKVKTSNLKIKVIDQQILAAESDLQSVRSGLWPTVDGTLAANRNNTAPDTVEYSAALRASQNLFRGFLDDARIMGAQRKLEKNRFSKARVLSDLSFELVSAYSNYLYSKRLQILAEDILRRREENQRLVFLRFQSGRENRGSLLLSDAYLEQGKLDGVQAQSAIETAQLRLSELVDEDFTEVQLKMDPLSDTEIPEYSDSRVTQTPEYQLQLLDEEMAQESIRSSRSGFFPSLDLSGSIGRRGDEFFPEQPNWNIGLNLSIPLFSGLKDWGSLGASRAQFLATQSQRLNLLRSKKTELKLAYQNAVEAKLQYRVDAAFEKALLVRSEIARNKYNNGLISFDDWDQIESDLIQRQKSLLLSKKSEIEARAQYQKALGVEILK